MDLLELFVKLLPYIFSGIAIAISLLSIYYTYWLGPKFRIQLLSKEPTSEVTNATTYEYYFVIVNNGSKTGVIKKLTSETSTNIDIIREKNPEIIRGKYTHPINEEEPFLIVGIEPKESVVIKCKFIVYTPKNQLPEYQIKFVVDKNVNYEELSDKDKKEIIIDKE